MTTAAKTLPQLLLRRDAIGAALSFAAGAVAGKAAGDAALLRQCATFQALHADLCGLLAADAEEEVWGEVHDRWHAALDAVVPMKAVTLAGIKAKAACLYPALRCLLGAPDDEIAQQQELQLALSITEDLARLEG